MLGHPELMSPRLSSSRLIEEVFLPESDPPVHDVKHRYQSPLRRRYCSEGRASTRSLSWYGRCQTSGISLVALRCTRSMSFLSAMLNEPQVWFPYSSSGLMMAMYRIGNILQSRLLNVCRMSLRMLFALDTAAAACSRNFSRSLTRTPQVALDMCLLQRHSLDGIHFLGVTLSQAQGAALCHITGQQPLLGPPCQPVQVSLELVMVDTGSDASVYLHVVSKQLDHSC